MPISLDGSGLINGLELPTDSMQPGLVHINTTSFNAASSVSLNNIFSSAYDDYSIQLRTTATAAGIVGCRLRIDNVDSVSANYVYQRTFSAGSAVSAARATSATFAPLTVGRSSGVSVGIGTIVGPFIVTETNFLVLGIEPNGGIETIYSASKHSLLTSYTGLTIFPESGTITGTVRVYGYRNSQ